MDSKEEKWMDHLVELRKRAIRVLIFFLIIFVISYLYVPDILNFLTLTSSSILVDLNVFSITAPLYLYIKVASIVAFALSFPYLIIQLWLYIRPALKKNERWFIYKYTPIMFILFFLGILFAYFVLIPYYVIFSQTLAGNAEMTIIMGANEYVDFMGKMLLSFGLVFQLPMLVLILSYIGLVSAAMLKFIRKYAYFSLVVVSAFLTPPDPVSMGIALVPLGLLYEVCIIVCRLSESRKVSERY